MRATSVRLYSTGQKPMLLPAPPPGSWRMLQGGTLEGGAHSGFWLSADPDMLSGRLAMPLVSNQAHLMKPSGFESGGMHVILMPRSVYSVADLVPRHPGRACSHCAGDGAPMGLKKCSACGSARYCEWVGGQGEVSAAGTSRAAGSGFDPAQLGCLLVPPHTSQSMLPLALTSNRSSRKCQLKHWAEHKKACKQVAAGERKGDASCGGQARRGHRQQR